MNKNCEGLITLIMNKYNNKNFYQIPYYKTRTKEKRN